MEPKKIVQMGYDQIAEQYLASKDADDAVTFAALEHLTYGLPAHAAILDLGCGAGVPVTQWLSQRFDVTGVDISARQLELARCRIPSAAFLQSDMLTVDFPAETFDAVVSFYAIIHVPRTEQSELLYHIYRWIKPGGKFLATWAVTEWEGMDQNWENMGAAMWWSHYDAGTNVQMLRETGFAIRGAEVRTDQETWLWVTAQKE